MLRATDSTRIAVIGTSCSGKTTLARALSERTGLPHVELDELFWGPNWTSVGREEFRRRVAEAAAEPAWIIDGNYSVSRDLVWARMNTVVWLNYPFGLVFRRALSRTLRRIRTQEELFAGNRERAINVFSHEWIPWWVMRTHHLRRRRYGAALRRPENAHLKVFELKGPADAEALLAACDRG